ncbi:hypothetical protein ACHWQZ_G002540 [Mnemiopsis leidyi]
MEFSRIVDGERILFECDVDLPDREIIDVCGGILKAEPDHDIKFSCQEQSSQFDVVSLIRQLNRLKEELTPSAALLSGRTLFPEPILPRSTFFPNSIQLPHPLLPAVVSSSPSSQFLESSWYDGMLDAVTSDKENTNSEVEELVLKSSQKNVKTSTDQSTLARTTSETGSLERLTLQTSFNTLLPPQETATSSSNQIAFSPRTPLPADKLTPTKPTRSSLIKQSVGRIMISSPSAWSPYSMEKETQPGQKPEIKEMSAKLPLFHYNLTDEKSFECKYCNYQAKQYNQLARHWKTHSGERPYQCGMCDYSAALKHNLVQHMWSKHTARKKYQCSDCDYSATRRDYLAAHRTQHTGYKPYMCSQCGWETGLKSNMTQHMKRKHSTFNV